MPTTQEEAGLMEAINTTLLQLVKVGVNFQYDILIQGTIGITVDHRTTTLVQINETVESNRAQVESSQAGCPPQPFVGSLPGPTEMTMSLKDTRWPAISDIQPVRMQKRFLEETPGESKYNFPLNETIAIDLDSDSESFSGHQFQDDWIGGDIKQKLEMKNIIVIEDGESQQLGRGESGFSVSTSGNVGMTSEAVVTQITPASSSFGSFSTSTVSCSNIFESPIKRTRSSTTGSDFQSYESERDVTTTLQTLSSFAGSNAEEVKLAEQLITIRNRNTDLLNSSSTSVSNNGTNTKVRKCDFTCEQCGRQFQTVGLLGHHLVETHDITETPSLGKLTHYGCTECTKKFRFKAHLDKHLFSHGGDKAYKCTQCYNCYMFDQSLDIHMAVHNEDSDKLHCTVCDKLYSSKQLFQKHIVYMHEMRRVKSK